MQGADIAAGLVVSATKQLHVRTILPNLAFGNEREALADQMVHIHLEGRDSKEELSMKKIELGRRNGEGCQGRG